MVAKLADIAAHAGLGVPTVSQILNGTPGRSYRADTRQRVLETAHKLGYRANSSARAMRAGRFSAIAVASSRQGGGRSWASPRMLTEIEAALHRHDLHLILSTLDDRTLTTERSVPKVLRELMADGMLLNYTKQIPAQLSDLIETHNLPVIWLNTIRDHDCVYVDNHGGFEQITRRLIEMGHRRIAYCGARPTPQTDHLHYSQRDRYLGYAEAMEQAGLTPRLIRDPAEDAGAALQADLTDDSRPTALVCYNIDHANAVLYFAAWAGLRVPDDLSIITMSVEGESNALVPLTRLQVHEAERARAAVEALRQKIQTPSKRLPPAVLTPQLLDESASVKVVE